jgi:hypothetical protein
VTNRAIASIKPALATNPDTQEMPSWMTMLFANSRSQGLWQAVGGDRAGHAALLPGFTTGSRSSS